MLIEHVPHFIKKIRHRLNKEKADTARKTLRRRDILSLTFLLIVIILIVLTPIAIADKFDFSEPRHWPMHDINRLSK